MLDTKLYLFFVLILILAVCDVYGLDHTHLIDAIRNNNAGKFDEAIAAKVNVNSLDSRGWSPLLWASKLDHVGAVKSLIEHGADVDISEADGWTALHFATFKGNVPITEYLLNAGADTSKVNKQGSTPLSNAQKGKNDNLKFVVETAHKQQLSNAHRKIPPPAAKKDAHAHAKKVNKVHTPKAEVKKVEKVKPDTVPAPKTEPISSGPDYASLFITMRAPDMNAFVTALQPHLDPKLPADKRLDWSFRNEKGYSFLIFASADGRTDLLEYMLKQPEVVAQINAGEMDGWTPLMFAAVQGNEKNVDLLLAAGASGLTTNKSDNDAAEIARNRKFTPVSI